MLVPTDTTRDSAYTPMYIGIFMCSVIDDEFLVALIDWKLNAVSLG